MYGLLTNLHLAEKVSNFGSTLLNQNVESIGIGEYNSKLFTSIVKDQNNKVSTHLEWVSNYCPKSTLATQFRPGQSSYGCIITSTTVDGTPNLMLKADTLNEGSRYLLLSTDRNSCGMEHKYYIINSTNSEINKLPPLPNNFMRNNFDYSLVNYFTNSDVNHLGYMLKSCLDDHVVYRAIYSYDKDEKFNLESYGPDFELCQSQVCKNPAVKFKVIGNDGHIVNENTDPNVFINEEDTYFDILFPQEGYQYLATGIRDDVYQILSNKFTMINIPIKIGEVHKYVLDDKAREAGEKNWIKIMIDYDGNGIYEKTVNVSSIFTGTQFLQQ